MLELLIAILFALGLSTEPTQDGRYVANQTVVDRMHASSSFEELGGDDALNAISIPDDVDPEK